MKTKRWMRRLSTFLLVTLLVSTLTLTAYASSEKYPYSFVFNMSPGTRTVNGDKTDMDESSKDYAGVSILAGNLGVGYVRFWVNNLNGHTISTISGYTNVLPNKNISLRYTDLTGVENGTTLKMHCEATANVNGLSGNFQP